MGHLQGKGLTNTRRTLGSSSDTYTTEHGAPCTKSQHHSFFLDMVDRNACLSRAFFRAWLHQ